MIIQPHATAHERGAGSILVLAAVMVMLTALLAAAVLASGHQARRQAAAAADLAALAAVKSMRLGEADPCAIAKDVAVANGAVLRDCQLIGEEAHIEVGVPVSALRDWLPEQRRWARAGPTITAP